MIYANNSMPRHGRLISTVALWLSLIVNVAIAAPPSHVAGSYEVTVKGSFTGKGTIAVGAKSVTIVLQVQNEAGAKGQLIASNLALENGRFSGKGTVLGVAMTISGRVDLPDPQGTLKVAWIQATFSTDANAGGRIVGTRRGTGS